MQTIEQIIESELEKAGFLITSAHGLFSRNQRGIVNTVVLEACRQMREDCAERCITELDTHQVINTPLPEIK